MDSPDPTRSTAFVWFAGLALSLVLPLGACSDDATPVEEAGDEATVELDGPPARGIDILEVEANQGTAVLIGLDGEWVTGPERNAFMIRNRDTMVRIQHTIDPNWVPREIMGVLYLQGPDGEELEPRTRQIFVEADSVRDSMNSSFYWSVAADEALPGTKYRVELLEVDDGSAASSLPEGLSVTPAEYNHIGYEETPLEMKIVVVPIHYTYNDPPLTVELSDSDIRAIEDGLFEHNPTQLVDVEIHETHTYSTHITDLGQMLPEMMMLKAAEGAAPNVYYHALVDVGVPNVNMVAGIAWLQGDDQASGNSRVASTVWSLGENELAPSGPIGTMIHEVGHNQGLNHVYCPNQSPGAPAANTDPNYPHDGGKLGVYGFGVRSYLLHRPTGHDYMTYCANTWVSDWTWNKTYKRIRTLTAWDYTDEPLPPRVPVLMGMITEDGEESWYVMPGYAPSSETLGAEQRLVFSRDGVDQEVLTAVSTLTDDRTTMILAALPAPLDEFDAINRLDYRRELHPVTVDHLELADRLDFQR